MNLCNILQRLLPPILGGVKDVHSSILRSHFLPPDLGGNRKVRFEITSSDFLPHVSPKV